MLHVVGSSREGRSAVRLELLWLALGLHNGYSAFVVDVHGREWPNAWRLTGPADRRDEEH